MARITPGAAFAVLLAACAAPAGSPGLTRVDEVPMYGGMDRSQSPAMQAADQKFIADVTAQFGSREKASAIWVEQGCKFYRADQNGMAMRRFNQAWLLDPKNPEVYTGFAAVLADAERFCEAVSMLEKSHAVGKYQDGFMPDEALILVGCAVKDAPADRKAAMLARSDQLFGASMASPVVLKDYTLTNWAKALYARGDYAGAWAKVAELRRMGKDVSPQFVAALTAKMPQPK